MRALWVIGLMVACGGKVNPTSPSTPLWDLQNDKLARTWAMLPTTADHCNDYDYFPGGGLRTLYCHAQETLTVADVQSMVGAPIWSSGPHPDGALDLQSSTSFGHYNPAFVSKLAKIAIPGAKNQLYRGATQSTFDQVLRSRARIAWAVHEKLAADPDCARREREGYLQNTSLGQDDYYYERWYSFMDAGFCGATNNNSLSDGGFDGNVTKTITAWWLRRQADGTEAEWHGLLKTLLQTYDAQWLKQGTPGNRTLE